MSTNNTNNSEIKKLDSNVVKKIAAGEVVERPASIVKELIENSIDANADEITIEVRNGGIDFIEVSDNGKGMGKEDLRNSVKLHYTSKLAEIEELDKIISHGFRGEALASINAVADVEIISAKNNAKAYKLTNSGVIEPTSRQPGTTITVKNLFRKIPARRKFLKTERTEELRIRNLVKDFAVNYPEIKFNYIADEREVYSLGSATKEERVGKIYNFSKEDLIGIDLPGDEITIKGIIAHPKTAKKRANQFISINNRIISDNLIAAAVKKGYGNKIPPELRPNFFLKLKMAGEEVDINIHPRKEEVKFSNEKEIFKQVLRAVEQTLANSLRSEFEDRFASGSEDPGNNQRPRQKGSAPQFSGNNKSFNKNSNYSNYSKNSNSASREQSRNYKSPSVSQAIKFSGNLLRDKSGRTNYNASSPGTKKPPSQPFEVGDYLQIFQTFILIEKDNKLLIIDQHAADERVKYDRLIKQFENEKIEVAPLLIPQKVELENNNYDIEKLSKQFEKLGFENTIKEESDTDLIIEIKSVPQLLFGKTDVETIFRGITTDLAEEGVNLENIEQKLDYTLATIACHSSIRAGERLQRSQIQKLIEDLWNSDNPYTCPHGRPIVIEKKKSELEREFLRQK